MWTKISADIHDIVSQTVLFSQHQVAINGAAKRRFLAPMMIFRDQMDDRCFKTLGWNEKKELEELSII